MLQVGTEKRAASIAVLNVKNLVKRSKWGKKGLLKKYQVLGSRNLVEMPGVGGADPFKFSRILTEKKYTTPYDCSLSYITRLQCPKGLSAG